MEGLKKVLAPIWSILFVLLFIISCSAPSSYVQKEPVKGVYHRVKKGETLLNIARAYKVKIKDLTEINNIPNPNLIEEGSVIFIPEASGVIDVLALSKKTDIQKKPIVDISNSDRIKSSTDNNNEKNVSNPDDDKPEPEKVNVKVKDTGVVPDKEDAAVSSNQTQTKTGEKKEQFKAKSAVGEKEDTLLEKKRFIWPVQGSVKTNFGIQPNKTYHNWIKIVSAPGSPVKAADDGTIIFCAPLKDYGKTIIVRHQNGYATVYTHLKKIVVKSDQKIKRGNMIANIGETDEAGDNFMNFEVRLHGKARNPLLFLP